MGAPSIVVRRASCRITWGSVRAQAASGRAATPATHRDVAGVPLACGRDGVRGRLSGTAGRQHRRAGAADATTGLRGADRQRRVGFHRLSADAGGARRATRAVGGPARSQDALLVGLRRLHRRLRIVRSGPYPGVADHLPRGAGRGCGYAAGQQRRHHHGCRAPPRAWSRHRRPGRRPGRRTLNRTVSWWSPHRYAGLAVGVLHRRAGRHRGNRVGPRGAAVHHSRSGGGGRF